MSRATSFDFPPPPPRGYDAGMTDEQKRKRLIWVVLANFALVVAFVAGAPGGVLLALFVVLIGGVAFFLSRRTA